MKMTLCVALLLGVLHPVAVHAEDGYGTVTGQFIFDGKAPELKPLIPKGGNVKDAAICAANAVPNQGLVVDAKTNGIANVFLYMRSAPDTIHPDLKDIPKDPAVLDQKGCVFFPRAMVVRSGQKVLLKSSDNCAHNTHSWPLVNDPFNYFLKANEQKGLEVTKHCTQKEILPIKITCDIHSWMKCYWMVIDHPYAVVTDAQGNFKIDKLPVGTHSFRVWHESAGYLEKSLKVTVKSGETTDLGKLNYAADRFEVE